MPTNDWTVERHLQGQPEASLALYRRFVELVESCGPFSYAVSKSTITFKGSRRGFAGAHPTGYGLTGYLDLQRPVTDPRFTNVSPYTRRLFVHRLRVTAPDQLDDDFAAWIREAYEVGRGAHLER